MTDQTCDAFLCNKTGNYGILPVVPKASWDRFTSPETKNGKKNGFRKWTDGIKSDPILEELEPSRSCSDSFSNDQCVKRTGVHSFAWFINQAFFSRHRKQLISPLQMWWLRHKWRNPSPSGILCVCGFRSNIKGHSSGHHVCLSNSQSFRLTFHLLLAADLFRSETAEGAWLSLLPDKGSTVPSVLFRSSICPRSYEITAMQCLPHIKSIHGLRKMLLCKWKGCSADVAQTGLTYTD